MAFDNPYSALSPRYQSIPTNLEAERALLGALLANNRAVERCASLRGEHFAGEYHGAIFEAIREGYSAGHVVDAVTLRWEFDPAVLTGLLAAMVGIVNVPDYARVIQSCAEARNLIDIGEEIVNAARTGESPERIMQLAQTRIAMLSLHDGAMDHQHSLNQAMDAAIACMEAAQAGKTAGISTGFKQIDRRLGGMEPGLMYVLAGRPGMGKSALGHQFALSVARAGLGVLELSLEMSATQLGMRTLSSASQVPISRIKAGDVDMLDAERIVRARKELANLPLTIDDAAGQTAAQIATKASASRRKHGLGLVLIDHLNLIQPEDRDARHGGTWATERASGTALQIAKDNGVPVVLLAQLNRGVESREDKRPLLSDLRQAGAIEQDAYAVGFVYRPEYYMTSEPEAKEGERSDVFEDRKSAWLARKEAMRGKAETIWAKVRDGEPGIDELLFDGPTTTFREKWA